MDEERRIAAGNRAIGALGTMTRRNVTIAAHIIMHEYIAGADAIKRQQNVDITGLWPNLL